MRSLWPRLSSRSRRTCRRSVDVGAVAAIGGGRRARAAARARGRRGAEPARGVRSAVGAGGGPIVWAEGFGWRDVVTRTPVTPDTRFNIGTAASVVTAAVASLGLTNTGADSAAEWSPEAYRRAGRGLPALHAPPPRHLQPLGLMPAEYPLPGDRATFYVPRSDDNPRRGRRLMYMRDLACCAGGMAFYSTPSDLVRFALATNAGSVNGELAGGMVMSLMTRRDSGIVVAGHVEHRAREHVRARAASRGRVRGTDAMIAPPHAPSGKVRRAGGGSVSTVRHLNRCAVYAGCWHRRAAPAGVARSSPAAPRAPSATGVS